MGNPGFGIPYHPLDSVNPGIHLASATGKPLGFLWTRVQGFKEWAENNLDSGLFSSLRGLPT